MNNSEKILINFKKASSLLNKIVAMKEDGEYCIDIMQQNLAVIGLLKSAHSMLMEDHLRGCFSHAVAAKDNKIKNKMTEEILKVVTLANK